MQKHIQDANCVNYVPKQGKCCVVNIIITPQRQCGLTLCHLHWTARDNTELNHCANQGEAIFDDKLMMYTTTGPLNPGNESIRTFFFAEIS